MIRFRALGTDAEVKPAVTEHRQRAPTFRGEFASAPLPETAAEPLTPECDPRRIPIRTVSRRGGLAYIAFRPLCLKASSRTMRTLGWMALAVVSVPIIADSAINPFLVRLGWNYYAPLYLMNGPFLMLTALSCPLLFYGFKGRKWDMFLGELSYPVYLTHVTIGGLVYKNVSSFWKSEGMTYILLTLVGSVVLLYAVVLPTDRLRALFGARIPSIEPVMP